MKNDDIVTLVIVIILVVTFVIVIIVICCTPTTSTVIRAIDGTHKANSLVLSCIDYRFISETIQHLYGINEANDFDYFVLAGASLGYNESVNHVEGTGPWAATYEEHIGLAIQLHNITEIIVIDHMDCGYYKAIYNNSSNFTSNKEERALHAFNINKFIEHLKLQTITAPIDTYRGLIVSHQSYNDEFVFSQISYQIRDKDGQWK